MIRVPKVYAPAKKSCLTCKHFDRGQCTAFASQEPVSGSVIFFDAIYMRLDDTKCGKDAKWYTSKNVLKNNIGFLDQE